MVSSGILYGTVTWQFLASVLKNFNIVNFVYANEETKDISQTDPLTVKWRYISCAVLALAIIPVNYQRSLGTLRYFSVMILVIICYTIFVAVIQFPEYYSAYSTQPKYHVDMVAAKFDLKWFQGFATLMLAFNGQVLFFYVRGELIHKSDERVVKLIRYLTMVLISVFLMMSITAYLSLGRDLLPKLYTLRRRITDNSSDYLMLAAQLLFTVAAFFKISLVLYPAREQMYIYYKLSRAWPVHLTITVAMSLIVFAVPCVYPDVTNLLGLLGGVTIGTAGYSIPLTLKLFSMRGTPIGPSHIFHGLLLIVVIFIQVSSTCISLFADTSAKK